MGSMMTKIYKEQIFPFPSTLAPGVFNSEESFGSEVLCNISIPINQRKDKYYYKFMDEFRKARYKEAVSSLFERELRLTGLRDLAFKMNIFTSFYEIDTLFIRNIINNGKYKHYMNILYTITNIQYSDNVILGMYLLYIEFK